MASRVQMMKKAFMNGDIKKDSFSGVNKTQNKEPSNISARWNVKKESSPSSSTSNAGSTTPKMGRTNAKKEIYQHSELKDKSGQSPQVTRRIHDNTALSSGDSNRTDATFTSKATLGNIGVNSRTTRSPVRTCIQSSESARDRNIHTNIAVNDTHEVNKINTDDVKPETNKMDKDLSCDSPKLGAKKDGKATRFAMRKQKRAKRHRSDGYMLALEMAANSSEDEGFQNDPSLGDAINFLQWIRNPTLQNLAKLRRAIKTNDKDWMKEFLEFDGLGLLFQCLKDLSAIQGFHLTDMVLKMECIMCIREVVNSQTGLDCLLQIKGRKDNIFGRRFASALETKNLMVKMQIFELLSALCVYSKDGYYLTLDALERYRSWQKLQYRMSVLLNEVRKSELATYKTTIMALINAIIFANENIRDRVRIRNEFLALNLLDTIGSLRCEDDDDLTVQCDVFEEEYNADTDALQENKSGSVNLNDPQSVFMAVYKKVQGTPLNATLLGILHSLLQIDSHSTQSESTWTVIERLTQEVLNNENNIDSGSLLLKLRERAKSIRDEHIQTENADSSITGIPSVPKPPPPPPVPGAPPPPPVPGLPNAPQPPPPPPPPGVPGAPPPPPVITLQGIRQPPPAPVVPGAPPPPAAPGAPPSPRPPGAPQPPGSLTPAQTDAPTPIDTPNPSKKLRTLTWNKIPTYAFKKESVWNEVLNMEDSIEVDYSKFEEMFSQKEETATKTTLSPDDDKGLIRRNSSHSQEVTLLDPKKSMNLNIFLKQFRKPNEMIIQLIKEGDARGLGVEKLKGLVKLLPLQDEIDMIQGYEGEVDKLGNAEKFFLQLIKLSDFKLRIEMMLLKGDFNSQLGAIRPNVQVLTSVCRKLMDNESLKVFLRFVLHAGNFLNKGSSAGGAIGFRIGSLNKLVMTKSNTAKMTLLHYLVEEAQQKNKDSLNFVDDLLEPLQKASRFSLDGMMVEFASLQANVNRLKGLLEHADEEVKTQFKGFILVAENDIGDTEEAIERVNKLSGKLAIHYCENEKSFKIDAFLESFKDFCEKVKTCEQDLETWRVNAMKAEQRRKTQEEIAERRRSGHTTHGLKPPGPEDRKIVDNIVNEIRKGKVLRRLSMRKKVTDKEIAAAGNQT
ncbi:inverted formin-2-like [Mercenaria mercenaria]|uniref:inverted formin-2-like n=1 Tax=Mercenaria mercenaria TaxID=6596 RepID=UPI00234E7AF1|nr:inverted formin-2-like [Mercenaria mercenaria]